MTHVILTDDDCRSADMAAIVDVIERALRAHGKGRLVAPPRLYVPFGDRGDLAFTVGGELGGTDAAGFRVYDRFAGDSPDRSELTAVFDSSTGAFVGAVVGRELGALRTGAIGGAAIRALSREDSRVLGLVGTGRQAVTQLAAAAAVRDLESVRVYSRDAARRAAFAEQATATTGVAVAAVDSAEAAVTGADIVITATNSGQPVIDPGWLLSGTHVSVIGPKFVGRAEWTPSLAERADYIVSDAPAQLRDYDRFLLADHPAMDRLVALGTLLVDGFERRDDDLTLFISTGLAGTEVLVAHALLLHDQP